MPRPTIYAVASKAGVSIATVSRVLNSSARVKPATRDKVQQAMSDLGYRPSGTARGLATQHTQTIAFLLPDLKDMLAMDCLRGIQAIAKSHKYHVLLVEQPFDPDAKQQNNMMLLPSKVDGYIIAPGCVPDETLDTLQKQQIPVVLLYKAAHQPGDAVIVDEEQTAYTAVTHLIKHSKRRIACIGDGLDASLRVRGYERALTAHGLTLNSHLFVSGGHDANAGYNAMQLLLDLAIPPQAVFVADDQAATGAVYAISKRGKRVPEDIALISYGNTQNAVFSGTPLSSVYHNAYGQGQQATELLIKRINDPELETEMRNLPTELITRSSCGCKLT